MKKLNWLLTVFAGAACIANAQQQVDDSAWEELKDEPSRRQLFLAKLHPKENGKPVAIVDMALPGKFTFAADALFDASTKKTEPPYGTRRGDVLFGIDVSHYDFPEKMSFERLWVNEIKYVYVKATQGETFKDGKFNAFWTKLAAVPEKNRPLKGAYHFLTAAGDPEVQAQKFVEFVRLHSGPGATAEQAFPKTDMPPCIDLEWDIKVKDGPDQWVVLKLTPDQILEKVTRCVNKIKALTGRTPMIYTARQWWIDCEIDLKRIKDFNDNVIWIADYAKKSQDLEKPRVFSEHKTDIWQFTETAVAPQCYGKSLNLDANIFYGKKEDFCKRLDITFKP